MCHRSVITSSIVILTLESLLDKDTLLPMLNEF